MSLTLSSVFFKSDRKISVTHLSSKFNLHEDVILVYKTNSQCPSGSESGTPHYIVMIISKLFNTEIK